MSLPFRWRPVVRRRRHGPARLRLELLEDRIAPAIVTVTATGDSASVDGRVTLREAITSINSGANANSDVVAVGSYGSNDTIAFNISGSGVQTIIPITALPALTRPVIVDGTTQTTNNGDTNPGTLGTGGIVGVGPDGVAGTGDELALPTVNRPEVEIRGTSAIASGLTIAANSVIIRGLAIWGFGTANIDVAQNSNNPLIEENVLGTMATSFTDPSAGARSAGANIRVPSGGTNNGVVRNNLIGFAGGDGIDMRGGAATWQIVGNEIRSNGLTNASGDGIDLSGQNTVNSLVRGNLVTGNGGFGVNLFVSNGNSTVDQNSIANNGVSGTQTAGVALGGPNNGIMSNVITANAGAGVLVNAAALGNPISRNSIFGNGPATGEIGIDLLSPSDNQTLGTAPFVTLNDSGDGDNGGNGLLNFPVVVEARISAGSLELTGFARPGSLIELFIAAPDSRGFGEGRTYLTTLTEGSAADLDGTTGSYGPAPINGLNQGSDTTNRFRFLIPLSSLPGVGPGTVLTATATSANSTSEFSGNVTVGSTQADLAVTKTVSNPTPNVGDTITFTVNLRNTGPETATNVVVNDLLPSGLVFVAATPSQGTYNKSTGDWFAGDVSSSAAPRLTLTARVATANPQTNTATISHSDQFDPNTGNNSASVTETPQLADLQVTKTVDDPTPILGTAVAYTITVTNLGPDAATNVTVDELTPPGLEFVSAKPSQGTFDDRSGEWIVGKVSVGSAPTLVITALVISPDFVTNTVLITHSDQFDPNLANNTADATVRGGQADLAVTKTVDNPNPNVGDTVTFTVTVSNLAGSAAHNVVVTDQLPAGLQFVSATTTNGSYSNTTGIWALADILPPGKTSTLTIRTTMLSTTAQTNTAKITNSDRPDPDPGNNSGSATVTPAAADLQINKSVSDPTPNVGDTITYTITLTNNGPSTATGVTVRDVLPPQLSLRFSRGAGSYDPITGIWTVGTIASGASETLLLTSQVISPNPQANTASVDHSDQFDPNTANNSDTASVNPLQADLAVSKTVSNPRPNVGDVITFTVTLIDNGPSNASGVQVTDLLPAGLGFVSGAPSQGDYDPVTGLWTVGTLANGAQVTLTLQAQVVSPATRTNTATISAADQFDPNTGNNSASAAESPQQADLRVTKSVDDPTPNVGDTITFTVSLSNAGPDTATNILLSDLLPAGLSFVSAAPSQGIYDDRTGVWTLGDLPTSAASSLTLVARVDSPSARTNTATITHSDQFDPNQANNSASAAETPRQADLQVTKTVSDPTPNVGDTITFTVTLRDLGPDAATNVQVTDLLPAGMSFVSAVLSQGSYDSPTGVWTVGTVGRLLPRTLILTARVDSANPETNTAAVSHADQFDPNTSNNASSAIETPQQADLQVHKSVDHAHPNVGDTITYIVTLTNSGPDAATGVQVSDLLPPGLSFQGATPSQGSYNPTTGLWSVGTFANGGVATLQVKALVNSPAPQFNTATVSAADQFDPNQANNSGGVLEVPQRADLLVGKSVSNPTPNVGDTITYTIHLTNSGPDTATGVAVQDALPAGVSFESSSATAGAFDPATRIWTLGTIASGATQTLTITAKVVSANPQANTATISAADQFDPNTANNSATAGVDPQQADLAITKTVSNARPNVGDLVTFTVTLTDNGPSNATNVRATDLLPPGLSLVSATPSQGSYDPVTGLWTAGSMASGALASLTLQALVLSPDARTNTATINGADQFDPQTGNNIASATETPQQADLQITKTVDDPTPNVGDVVTFTVVLVDNGTDTATNVTVQDLLPAGLALVSATPSQGTYNSTTGVWDVGAVDGSSARTLVLRARAVSASSATNTATISHSDQFDPVIANNTASATETPQQADLRVNKTVSNPTPNVGDTILFTVTVTDSGPDSATGVEIQDLLPVGLTLVSATQSQGNYDGTTGLWTVGQVDTTAPVTLTLRARVDSPNPATNTATVSHSDQFDPQPGNNRASATETPKQAELQLTKTVNNPTPNVGDTVAFTVTLTNNGPAAATDVVVLDRLPSGLNFVSATPGQGSYDRIRGIWTVGTVNPGTPQTLVFTARVVSPAPRTNTAAVSHADQFDPDTNNNTASATETPKQADLQVTKTTSNPTPNVGDTLTFTVTLNNAGADAASNVTVQDLLPAGLTFVSATPSQGTYNSTTGVWTVGTVTTTTPLTLLLRATVSSPATRTNTASVSHSDQFDPNTGNNSASATETPQQADLQVTKTVSNPTPNVGDTITYTVLVRNSGPDAASGVTLDDALPSGVSFQSSSATEGAFDPTTGVWTIGTVASGASQTLTITASVISANPQANTATIGHSDQFDPNTANNSDTAGLDPQQADLAISKTVSNARPNVGDTITFTVTLSDNGPSNATGVQVTDLLPAGLTLISESHSQGSYDAVTGLWTVGSLANGAQVTLTLQAQVVSPAARTNTATITAADQFDPNSGNNNATATETPQQADLQVTKTVDDANPNVGDSVTFTVTLTDNGPDAATAVTVQDLLPAGLTFVSATPSQGTYSNTTGVWSVGTVTTANPRTLLIRATVTSPGPRTNTASVSHSDQFDPNAGNNAASATETPQQADLRITKTVSNPTPNFGDTVTFTVSLTNNGPDPATNVVVVDRLPAGLNFLSATPSQGSYDRFRGIWTVGTVNPGAPQTLVFTAQVASPNARTNTATIDHADQFDPNPANNHASAIETPQQADLRMSKTVDHTTPNVGDVVTFTVTLTNQGPGAATSVTVADLLPAGLTFVSATPSLGSYDAADGVWTVGRVASGAAQTLLIRATVASPAPQTNIAAVSHGDQFDPDTNNNSASATETPQRADLALTKTVSDPTPNVGDTVTFTVTLTNSGPDAATNVVVLDRLPAGLSFVSATPSQGTYDRIRGIWTVGTVNPNIPLTLVFTAQVASPDARTNTAKISHSDQFDPQPGNNQSSATETPQQADLQVTKTVDNPTPNVGNTITYTITLTNNGPDAATNVTVLDILPPQVGLRSIRGRGSYNPATGIWTVGTIAAGASETLFLTSLVVSPNPRANTASVHHADQFDPNVVNNSDTASIDPLQADLAVSKTVSNARPNVGDTVTFTVTLTDSGPSSATGVQVTDLLPAGLSFVSAAPSQGTYNSATGRWTVGSLANGTHANLSIHARVIAPGPRTNTATISHSDQFDADKGNNTASATETPRRADLTVGKSVSDPTPNVGDTITFTVSVANRGPDAATNVTVHDLLPAGLTFVSAMPSRGTYDSTTGDWVVGTVNSSAAQTLTLVARVVAPQAQTNTATISASDQFDPNPDNNRASATETPQQADLALAKSVSNPTPNVGETITFTVTLSNRGPDAATNVAVHDLLPAGLQLVTAIPSLGSYNARTGRWRVGTLDAGTNATLTIEAAVISPGAQTNTASVSHADQFDPDPANNTDGTTETPRQADLSIAKTVSNPTPNVGDVVTFTVTLTNSGPDAATGVTVTDPLPAGLELVAATPSQGAYNPITGVWTVGTVSPGAAPTLQLRIRVASHFARTNTATISHSDQFDPNSGNNQSSATETPQRADLDVSKTVSNPAPNVGDVVTFTVTLSDHGPDAATSVTVHDLLPAGLTFVSATPSQGTYDSTTGLWTVGTVTTTTPLTLLLRATVTAPISRTNTASVSRSDQFDPNPGNNQSSAGETPQRADLQVTKSVSNPTPNVGEVITFTVTLLNAGPDTATGVAVRDMLPGGVTFVSATPSQGSYNFATGVWTVGTVNAGGAQTLVLSASVSDPGNSANTASVSHSDQFDPNPANNSDTTGVDPQQADLAILKSVDRPRPNVGDTITFTITLNNSGPGTATGVTVNDPLPPGLRFVSATASQGTYDSITGVWTVGTATTRVPQTLQIVARVVSQDAQTNTAAVGLADQFDPDTSNNTGSITETPQQADLLLTKIVSNSTPNVGDTVTFTVNLSDTGPDPATNVTVLDLLPSGLTLVSATPSRGTYNAVTGAWSVGNIDPSATQTLVLTARVVSPDAQTNTAALGHADQFDPITTNNSASASLEPQHAELALAKTVSDPAPNVGDVITFTVTLTNNGPDVATNVQVSDLLPAGLTLVSATTAQGAYDAALGVWTVGTVASGSSTALSLQARIISPGARTNTATIINADQFDPTTNNNSASASETPRRADLSVTKTVDHPTPNVGDVITYTVTVTGNGPDDATDVELTDLLPSGVASLSATATQGTYSAATGIWTVGSVAGGSSPTLKITVRVISPIVATNRAAVSHAAEFDPNAGNNSATARVTPRRADLALTKTVDNPSPSVGDFVIFTITVTDHGPDDASHVRVLDQLPAGVSFVSAAASQGAYDAATGVWSVGNLARGKSGTLRIRARVTGPEVSKNIASISGSDQFDPNPLNNGATAIVTPRESDLAITKTVDHQTAHVGDVITYTITLTNQGLGSATGVKVTDLLPPGLAFVAARPSQGTYDPTTGVWNVGRVDSGARAVLLVSVKVVKTGLQPNVAAVTASDSFEANRGNNVSSVVVVAMPAVPPTVTSLQRFGFHAQPTELVLTFSTDLDPARARDVSNYLLTLIGPRGRLGPPIPIASADYSRVTDTVTLHPARRLDLHKHYRIVVNGMPPNGLASPSGTFLDGLGNGKPGSDYTRIFGAEILAGPFPGFRARASLFGRQAHPGSARPAAAEPPSRPDPAARRDARAVVARARTAVLVRINAAALDAVLGAQH